MVRGYHIYVAIRIYVWDALTGAELSCQREAENYTDPFAVAVTKDDNCAKMYCNVTCTFVPETFKGINFQEIVLPHEKSKN